MDVTNTTISNILSNGSTTLTPNTTSTPTPSTAPTKSTTKFIDALMQPKKLNVLGGLLAEMLNISDELLHNDLLRFSFGGLLRRRRDGWAALSPDRGRP